MTMEDKRMVMNSDSPLRTIKFRPLPRSRKTEHVRPLKTIRISPPSRGEKRPPLDDPYRPAASSGRVIPSLCKSSAELSAVDISLTLVW